jgi:hypothetical protein
MTLSNVTIDRPTGDVRAKVAPAGKVLAALPGDSAEIRITVARDQAERKLFGFVLFGTPAGGGLPILLRPENGTLRVGTAEAPFSVADLPPGEDVQLRIFVDKYLVEVFANDRQAMVASFADYRGKAALSGFTVGEPTTIKTLETWKLEPTNQGFLEARRTRAWEPSAR